MVDNNTTKTSLIFGGKSGIGAAIASKLSSRGDKVLTASRAPYGDKNHLVYDLLGSDKLNLFTKVDYLVFSQRCRGESARYEHELMIQAPVNFLKRHMDMMTSLSSIVFLGSTAGQNVIQEQDYNYHATRAGIEALTRYLAADLGSRKVRVNCILTTTLIKPSNAEYFSANAKARSNIEKITPLKRLGEARDVANAVEFFLSPNSSFVTGQTLMVDGGASVLSPETVAKIVLKN